MIFFAEVFVQLLQVHNGGWWVVVGKIFCYSTVYSGHFLSVALESEKKCSNFDFRLWK